MSDWKLKRLIIEIATGLLIIGGALAAVAAGIVFWQRSDDHHWYTAVVAVFVGLGTWLAAWLVAALFSLAVEVADNLRSLASPQSAGSKRSAEELWMVSPSTAAELGRERRNGEDAQAPAVHSLGIRKAMEVHVGSGILLSDAAGSPQIQWVEAIDLWDGDAGHLKFTISGGPPVHLRYDDQVIASL